MTSSTPIASPSALLVFLPFQHLQYIQSPVSTICMGQACSMASLILAAGAQGSRQILPNARVMLHQPSGGAQV